LILAQNFNYHPPAPSFIKEGSFNFLLLVEEECLKGEVVIYKNKMI
jgi:hypothetical protein